MQVTQIFPHLLQNSYGVILNTAGARKGWPRFSDQDPIALYTRKMFDPRSGLGSRTGISHSENGRYTGVQMEGTGKDQISRGHLLDNGEIPQLCL